MPYKAEVLFRQGWFTTVHWSEDEAAQAVDLRRHNAEGTANPPIDYQVKPLMLQETHAPDKTFDEWCDEQWPTTATSRMTTSVPSSGSTSKPSPSEDDIET